MCHPCIDYYFNHLSHNGHTTCPLIINYLLIISIKTNKTCATQLLATFFMTSVKIDKTCVTQIQDILLVISIRMTRHVSSKYRPPFQSLQLQQTNHVASTSMRNLVRFVRTNIKHFSQIRHTSNHLVKIKSIRFLS